jgi:hypothetical protein
VHDGGTEDVIDYKAGKRANRNKFPMPLYVLDLEAKALWVRGATYYLMRDAGDGKGTIVRTRIPRTKMGKRGVISDVTLQDKREAVREMVKGIRACVFEVKVEEVKFGFCDYRILCPSFEGGT